MKINIKNLRKKEMSGIKKDNIQFAIMVLPVVLKVFIFSYLPMCGIFLAFKDLNYELGIFKSPWVGFKNFEFFFKSNDATRLLLNTVFTNFTLIVSGTAFAVIMSLLMYQIVEHKKSMKFYQTTMFFPYFVSWVVVSLLLENIIGTTGLLTKVLEVFGVKFSFYTTPWIWRIIFPVINIWKLGGYYSIIYFGILIGTDVSLYEAAKVDGASNLKIMIKLQIPFLIPMIVLQTIASIGNIFRADFGMFYFLPGSNNTILLETTDVIDTYIFRALKGDNSLSMGAAVGLFQSLVGFVLITITNAISKKYDSSFGLY